MLMKLKHIIMLSVKISEDLNFFIKQQKKKFRYIILRKLNMELKFCNFLLFMHAKKPLWNEYVQSSQHDKNFGWPSMVQFS